MRELRSAPRFGKATTSGRLGRLIGQGSFSLPTSRGANGVVRKVRLTAFRPINRAVVRLGPRPATGHEGPRDDHAHRGPPRAGRVHDGVVVLVVAAPRRLEDRLDVEVGVLSDLRSGRRRAGDGTELVV